MAKTYNEKLKDPRWQKKRLEIFQRDKWKCKKCGDDRETLCIHHLNYNKNGNPWDVENESLVTLCETCHSIIENSKDEFNFNELKIFKLNRFTNGTKLTFISRPDKKLLFQIIKDDDYDGYIIPDIVVKNILKFIKNHL